MNTSLRSAIEIVAPAPAGAPIAPARIPTRAELDALQAEEHRLREHAAAELASLQAKREAAIAARRPLFELLQKREELQTRCQRAARARAMFASQVEQLDGLLIEAIAATDYARGLWEYGERSPDLWRADRLCRLAETCLAVQRRALADVENEARRFAESHGILTDLPEDLQANA